MKAILTLIYAGAMAAATLMAQANPPAAGETAKEQTKMACCRKADACAAKCQEKDCCAGGTCDMPCCAGKSCATNHKHTAKNEKAKACCQAAKCCD